MKFYIIYGKMNKMKKMLPVSGTSFVRNLIYAEVYTVRNEEDFGKVKKEVDFLNNSGQGIFELRETE